MIFHRAKLKYSDTNIPVIPGNRAMSNTILEQVTFIKFLGVIIDNKLTFERHIVYTKNTISKGLGIITKARKYESTKPATNFQISHAENWLFNVQILNSLFTHYY